MFEGVSLPFKVQELMDASISLFGSVDEFLILMLAIVLGPYFIRLIVQVMSEYQERRDNAWRYHSRKGSGGERRSESLSDAWEAVRYERGWKK